jgi:type I restriction enzyme S subunit
MKLPKDWHWEEVAKLAEINARALPANTPKEYAFRYIDISCVSKGRINWPKDTITFSESPSRARRLVGTLNVSGNPGTA